MASLCRQPFLGGRASVTLFISDKWPFWIFLKLKSKWSWGSVEHHRANRVLILLLSFAESVQAATEQQYILSWRSNKHAFRKQKWAVFIFVLFSVLCVECHRKPLLGFLWGFIIVPQFNPICMSASGHVCDYSDLFPVSLPKISTVFKRLLSWGGTGILTGLTVGRQLQLLWVPIHSKPVMSEDIVTLQQNSPVSCPCAPSVLFLLRPPPHQAVGVRSVR